MLELEISYDSDIELIIVTLLYEGLFLLYRPTILGVIDTVVNLLKMVVSLL